MEDKLMSRKCYYIYKGISLDDCVNGRKSLDNFVKPFYENHAVQVITNTPNIKKFNIFNEELEYELFVLDDNSKIEEIIPKADTILIDSRFDDIYKDYIVAKLLNDISKWKFINMNN
jgi:hypothetical protein